MSWPETAKRVAELVVRPVIVKDGPTDKKTDLGVGLFIGEECRFTMPMKEAMGAEDFEKLTDDLRQIVELAIIKAWGFERLTGGEQ